MGRVRGLRTEMVFGPLFPRMYRAEDDLREVRGLQTKVACGPLFPRTRYAEDGQRPMVPEDIHPKSLS